MNQPDIIQITITNWYMWHGMAENVDKSALTVETNLHDDYLRHMTGCPILSATAVGVLILIKEVCCCSSFSKSS